MDEASFVIGAFMTTPVVIGWKTTQNINIVKLIFTAVQHTFQRINSTNNLQEIVEVQLSCLVVEASSNGVQNRLGQRQA